MSPKLRELRKNRTINTKRQTNKCTDTCVKFQPIPEEYNLHSIILFVLLFPPHVLISSNGLNYGMNLLYTVNWDDHIYSPIYLVNQMNIGMFIYLFIIITFMFVSFLLIIISLILNKIKFCEKLIFYQSIIILTMAGSYILIQFAIDSPSIYDFNLFSFGVCYLGTCIDYFIIDSKPKSSILPKYGS